MKNSNHKNFFSFLTYEIIFTINPHFFKKKSRLLANLSLTICEISKNWITCWSCQLTSKILTIKANTPWAPLNIHEQKINNINIQSVLIHVIHILFSFPPRSKKHPNKDISRKNNLETQLQIHSLQPYTLDNANRLKTFNIKGKKVV